MSSPKSKKIIIVILSFIALNIFFLFFGGVSDNSIVSNPLQLIETGNETQIAINYGSIKDIDNLPDKVDLKIGMSKSYATFDGVSSKSIDTEKTPTLVTTQDLKQKIEMTTERIVNDFVWVETSGFVPATTGGKIILSSIGQKTFKCDGTVDNPDCFEIDSCAISQKPCYEYDNGNTIVYVNHFSGAFNTLTWTTDSDWDGGTHVNTTSSSGDLTLSGTNTTGRYTSNTTDTLETISRLKATWNTTDSWNYKKEINISNTGGAFTDYQVKIVIDKETSMNADYSDLRFTDNSSNQLNYWVEENNTVNATVWVKTNFSALTNTTIFMYYGNPTATSKSNATLVFDPLGDWKTGWKYYTSSSCTGPTNWEKLSFDDSGWTDLADASLDSWPNGGPMDWYMRKKLFISSISISTMTITSDDGQWSYAGDGTSIGHCGGACHAPGTCTDAWTITSTLKKGDNVVAIQCTESAPEPQYGERCLVDAFSIPNAYTRKYSATEPTLSSTSAQMPGDISVEFSADG
ncbi:MAG: DUF2341 domain-containing protein, partial [Nanohaloarchaea archaeon]|nr:DUF2341 domain-containing protein [Candidatus Nanohaloarchaea archaeon]